MPSVLALKAHDRDEEGQQRLESSTMCNPTEPSHRGVHSMSAGSDSWLLWDLPEEQATPAPHGDDATAWQLWHAVRDQRQCSGSGSRSLEPDSGDACSDWSAASAVDWSAEPDPPPPQTHCAAQSAWDPYTSARPESRRGSYSPAGSGPLSIPRSGASGITFAGALPREPRARATRARSRARAIGLGLGLGLVLDGTLHALRQQLATLNSAGALPREPRAARASMDQITLDLDVLGLDSGSAPGGLVELPSRSDLNRDLDEATFDHLVEPRAGFSLGDAATLETSVPSMMDS